MSKPSTVVPKRQSGRARWVFISRDHSSVIAGAACIRRRICWRRPCPRLTASGMRDGRYRLGSLEVEVKDGKCMNGGNLAGSVLTMDLAVRNVMQFAQWDLQQTVRLATLNPARVANLNGGLREVGLLKAGAP